LTFLLYSSYSFCFSQSTSLRSLTSFPTRRSSDLHLFLPSLGELGQRRLRAAKVAVIGVGGLGSPALQYLAGAGVGTVGLFDDDVVEMSNLHRQVLHTVADVGRPKGDSGSVHLVALSPDLQIHRHQVRLEEDNTTALLRGYDL